MLGAGAGQEEAAILGEVQGQAVHGAVRGQAFLHVLAALHEGGRVHADQAEALALCAQVLQPGQGVDAEGLHPVRQAGKPRALGRTIQRRARGVQAGGRGRPGPGAGQAQAPGVGEHVQRAAVASMIGGQAGGQGAVGAHVVEPAGLLAAGQGKDEAAAVLLDFSLVRHAAQGQLDRARQALQLAARQVVLEEDARGPDQVGQRGHDLRAQPLHACGADLHGQDVAEAVHHQAGQQVALAEHEAVIRRVEEVLAQGQGRGQARTQQFGVQRAGGVLAVYAPGDERARIHVGAAQRPALGRLHAHAVPRRKGGERAFGHVHLVAEDPQVTGQKAAVLVLAQGQHGQAARIRRAVGQGHSPRSLRRFSRRWP